MFEMIKKAVIIGLFILAVVCPASAEDFWRISVGSDHVTEFRFEQMSCVYRCRTYAVAGRPDEIFVTSFRENLLAGIRRGEINMPEDANVTVLNYQTKHASLMTLEQFLELDILFEELDPGRLSEHSKLNYAGDPKAHSYVAPISRSERKYVAALSSKLKATKKETFGIPSPIPFMGRQKWVQKETTYTGTLFLEVFNTENPSEAIVRLHKTYYNRAHAPFLFDVGTWAQGSKEPIFTVVCFGNRDQGVPGRMLLIRP